MQWRWIVVALACLALVACSNDGPKTEHAFTYRIVKENKEFKESLQQQWLSVAIVPQGEQALNKQSMGDTVMRAALDLAKDAKADAIYVSLFQDEELYKNYAPALAYCMYYPAGIGNVGNEQAAKTWYVTAAEEPFSPQHVDMYRLWVAESPKFSDESALRAHLSKMTGVPPDEILHYPPQSIPSDYFKE